MAEAPRKKSPRAPSIPLSEALERAVKVYDRERLHPAPVEVVAADMGYKSANNGAALSTIASLRYFGLLDRPKDGFLAIAKEVEDFRFSPSEAHRQQLLMQFVKTPPLYAELLEKYATGLPSDATLRYELIQRGFIPSGAENALNAFKQSIQFSGYFDILEPAKSEEPETATEPLSVSTPVQPAERLADSVTFDIGDETLDKIPVRLSGGRKAWLFIPAEFYAADRTRLKAHIDLLLANDEGD